MKNLIKYTMILFIAVIITSMKIDITGLNKNKNHVKNEDFNEFFENFSLNEGFQISRIKFPFMSIHFNEEYTKRDTSFINQSKWIHRQFYFGKNNDRYGQIYDNFDHKLKDTDERVFAWHGIGNGIKDFLYFKRINGLWFLIKEEDLSS